MMDHASAQEATMSQPTLRPVLVLAAAFLVATSLRLSVTGESELDRFPGAMPELHRMSVQQQVRGWDEVSDDLIVERGHEVCEIGRTFLTQPDLMLDEMDRRWPEIADDALWPFARLAAVFMCEAELGFEIIEASRA